MKRKKVDVIIVVIYDESGIAGEKLRFLDDAIREFAPDYHELFGEHSFHVVFKNDPRNQEQAEKLISLIQSLVERDSRFRKARLGCQAGEGVCQVDAWGRVRSVPLGAVDYQALKSAVS